LGLTITGVIADWYFYDGLSDAAASAFILEKSKGKTYPIVVVSFRTTNTSELAAAYAGSNDVQAGKMMSGYILKQLPAGGGWGHIQGPSDTPPKPKEDGAFILLWTSRPTGNCLMNSPASAWRNCRPV
jgi:hypothetical protein